MLTSCFLLFPPINPSSAGFSIANRLCVYNYSHLPKGEPLALTFYRLTDSGRLLEPKHPHKNPVRTFFKLMIWLVGVHGWNPASGNESRLSEFWQMLTDIRIIEGEPHLCVSLRSALRFRTIQFPCFRLVLRTNSCLKEQGLNGTWRRVRVAINAV